MAEGFGYVSLPESPSYETVYKALKANYKTYSGLFAENTKLEETPTIARNVNHSFFDESSGKITIASPTKKDEKLQEKIKEYIDFLNSCTTEDDVYDVVSLISSDGYRTNDIIIGVLAYLNKDYRDLEIIVESGEDTSGEFKKKMLFEGFKMELLRRSIFEELKEDQTDDKEEFPYKIVLAYPSVDNPNAFSEIQDDIDSYFYTIFKGLLLSFLKYGAVNKRHLYFANGSFLEAKSRTGGRVVCTRLTEDTFLVVRVFMKDCYNSSQYYGEMKRILSDCDSRVGQILERLNDPIFIEKNRKNLEQMWSILEREEKSSEDPPAVKKIGGINK